MKNTALYAILLSFLRAIQWCKDHKNPLSIAHVTKCATIHVGFAHLWERRISELFFR